MAIDVRHVHVTKPPKTGETLANLPLLKVFAKVLDCADKNLQNGNGANIRNKIIHARCRFVML